MSSDLKQPDADPFRRVAILGLGVMGGSLARALAAAPDAPVVTGWSPDGDERDAALSAGVVSAAPESWRLAVADVDLVVLAIPLDAACELLGDLADPVSNDAVVMDVASLKAPVLGAAIAAGLAGQYVGAHPMAGSEESGFAASKLDLFDGARVWIVASDEAGPGRERVEAMWRSLGALPQRTTAEPHDRLMTLASHLPQLTANALAGALADLGVVPADLGPGGQDMTRLARSDPAMWSALVAHAPADLVRALRTLAQHAEALAQQVELGDTDAISSVMARSREWSER